MLENSENPSCLIKVQSPTNVQWYSLYSTLLCKYMVLVLNKVTPAIVPVLYFHPSIKLLHINNLFPALPHQIFAQDGLWGN